MRGPWAGGGFEEKEMVPAASKTKSDFKRVLPVNSLAERIDSLAGRLERIEAALSLLLQQNTAKEWYGTAEVGKLLGKTASTVRERFRLGGVGMRSRSFVAGIGI
jgi:hypothetical protein